GLARVGRARRDPALEVGGDGRRQPLLRRHLQTVVPQRLENQTLLGVAGDDGRAGVAAGADAVAGVEPQAALELRRLVRVARVALLDKDGTDLLLEELHALAVVAP